MSLNRGNELADEAAKAALSSTVSSIKCPASDFIPELTMHYHGVWQGEWDGCSANKLHSVKPHLGYCSVTHLYISSYWSFVFTYRFISFAFNIFYML